MNLRRITGLAFALLLSTVSFAQKQTFSGIQNFRGSAISPIFEKSEVKGYMLYYSSDKADKKNDNYVIDVYDQDLTKVKSIVMSKPRKSVILLRNSFNGTVFSFYFYNYRDNYLELETYDRRLTKLASIKITELSKMDKGYIQQEIEKGGNSENNFMSGLNFYPVPGKGFIRNNYEGLGKSYGLEMYDNSLKLLWKFKPEESKDYEGIGITEVTDKYLMGTIVRRPGMMSKKMNFYVAAFDVKTGKKVLDMPVETKSNEQLSLSSINFDEQKQEFLVIGEFYNIDDKPFVNKSQGFFIKRFGLDGKERVSKIYSWNKEVKSLLPAEAKKSVEDNYINFIHKVIKDSKGNTYLVAEQYKIIASGGGIAIQAMGGSASSAKGKIGNLMVFAVSPSDELTEIKFYKKDETDCMLPAGAGWLGAGLLGHIIKMEHGFDYQFTQSNNTSTDFSIAYLDNAKKDKEIKTSLINVLFDDAGKFDSDKIDLSSDKKDKSYIYPGKTGYNLIVGYTPKEKAMEMKLIKLNK